MVLIEEIWYMVVMNWFSTNGFNFFEFCTFPLNMNELLVKFCYEMRVAVRCTWKIVFNYIYKKESNERMNIVF